MRILFIAAPGVGHLLPLVATAWAARCAGHEVLVATTGPSLDMAARSGLPAVEVSDGTATEAYYRLGAPGVAYGQREPDFSQSWKRYCTILATPRSAYQPTPGNKVTALIAEISERMVTGIIGVARGWRADVLVYGPFLGVGMLVAADMGIPAILHGIGMPSPAFMPMFDKMPDTLARLGIPAMSQKPAATIDLCPPSLRPAGTTYTTQDWPCRYVPSNGGAVLPDWLLAPSAPQRICVTLGSVLPDLGLDELIDVVLDAIATAHVEVVVTGCDRLAQRALPATVRIASWVPFSTLLPTCQAIIHHGGSGTTFTALCCGVPQVVLPQLPDQSINAGAVVARGLGVALSPDSADRAAIASHLDHVLTDPATHKAAAEVAAEIAAMPGPDDIARRLSTVVPHDTVVPHNTVDTVDVS